LNTNTIVLIPIDEGMPPEARVNFAARFEYLWAIEQLRPEVLSDLQNDTFAVYRTYLQSNSRSSALPTLAHLSAALRDCPSPELINFDHALHQWANTKGLRDAWMWDAAVQTMYNWAHGGTVGKWGYFPEELNAPKFQPDFGYWIPQYTEWADFKKATDAIYRSALANYRAEVRKMWGEGQMSLSGTAVWTVLWQQGKSPAAIQHHHFRTTGQNVSLAAIQQGVHAFAVSGGVTLRKPKAGRGAKKI
jgi:hypothetical protein